MFVMCRKDRKTERQRDRGTERQRDGGDRGDRELERQSVKYSEIKREVERERESERERAISNKSLPSLL